MIGLPLGSPNWWERCTDQDGNPVHVMTRTEITEALWTPAHDIWLDNLCEKLSRHMAETLDETIKQGEQK
jgi:hypothetical protein